MSEGGNDVNYYMEGCNPNEVGQLELAEGEPRYSLGELLAWAVEWAREADLHKLDSGERRMYFAEDAATAFLAYIAHQAIGARLRPTVRLESA